MRRALKRWFIDQQLECLSGRGYITMIVILICAGILILTPVTIYSDRRHCGTVGTAARLPARWTFWAGCFIKVDDQWVPLDRWIYMNGRVAPR